MEKYCDSVFSTSDLATASFLYSQDELVFAGLAPKDRRSSYFTFTPEDKARKLALLFLSGTATINAKRFANSYRTLKDLLHDQWRQGW